MNKLGVLLKKAEDGCEYILTFECRDVFGLADFEQVDESIYDRCDVYIANVVSHYKCDRKLYPIGNKIEFFLGNVITVTDPANGKLIYEKDGLGDNT